MTALIAIRRATPADAVTLAAQRVAMFHGMGSISPSLEPALRDASTRYFDAAVASGEYVSWLAFPAEDAQHPIGGAGLQLRSMLPRPDPSGGTLLLGLEGLVLNVYVDPGWRRRGVAGRLMTDLIAWTRANGVVRLVLHASSEGRPLYESLGFIPTNEMRYTGALARSRFS